METKQQIRKRVLDLRGQLSEEERKRGNLLVTERILGHQWFYRAEKILCFSSYGSEIDTGEIIKEAVGMQKKVYLPKVEGEKLQFYRIYSLEDLTEGYRGIREPKGDTEKYLYAEEEAEKVLMLMPGAAFDRYRNRIGYGKGFYDRYLADKELLQLHTIAIGFACQLVDEIPAEETDIKPYQVICL